MHEVHSSLIRIRSPEGKLLRVHSSIVQREPPIRLNLIQELSIPLKLMQTEDFHVRAYRTYRLDQDTGDAEHRGACSTEYLNPDKYTKKVDRRNPAGA